MPLPIDKRKQVPYLCIIKQRSNNEALKIKNLAQ